MVGGKFKREGIYVDTQLIHTGVRQKRTQHCETITLQFLKIRVTNENPLYSTGCVLTCCHVQLFLTPWNAAHQAPLFMEFSRQEHWSELPFLTPDDLPDPGIKPEFLVSPALAGGFFTCTT